MIIALKWLAGALAVGLAGLGVAWLLVPDFASAQLGMTLLEGAGLSSQIGDGAGYFITLGGSILLGLTMLNPIWFYTAVSLLSVATLGRISAWLFHGAPFTAGMILFEVFLVVMLIIITLDMRAEAEKSE